MKVLKPFYYDNFKCVAMNAKKVVVVVGALI